MHRFSWKLAVVGLFALTGCRPEFQLKKFTTNEALFQASLRQFQRGKWDDAAIGFEKLTLELAPRDTLAARSFWYLGVARQKQHDFQLAAQAFNRIFESFPDDSLMDDALYEEGRSYQSMWTRSDRDGSFGDAALATYSSLMTYRPDSPLIAEAKKQIALLENMFATKNYDIGMYYFRDHGFDSAILYFKLVLESWPEAPKARDAALKLIAAYRDPTIRYLTEANEICAQLRTKYPNDAEIARVCPTPAPDAQAIPAVATPVKPPAAGVKPPAR